MSEIGYCTDERLWSKIVCVNPDVYRRTNRTCKKIPYVKFPSLEIRTTTILLLEYFSVLEGVSYSYNATNVIVLIINK